MIGIAYLRVSGLSQTGDKDGLPRQRRRIEELAEREQIRIVAEYADEGVTGKSDETAEDIETILARPDLTRLRHDLKDGKYGDQVVVLIESLERLARDVIVQELFVRLVRKHAQILSAECPELLRVTGDAPTDNMHDFMRQVRGAAAEFDRKNICYRMACTRKYLREENGKCEGRKSYGEDPERPEEQLVLARMLSLRDGKNGYREIAKILNEDGYSTRTGKPWSRGTVYRILKRYPVE
jgi:DNA invertase Pin-like site-specific DNA recombinase